MILFDNKKKWNESKIKKSRNSISSKENIEGKLEDFFLKNKKTQPEPT